MAVAWPSGVPQYVLANAFEAIGPRILRSEVDAGEAKQRRLTTGRIERLRVSWRFTPAQAATFRTWLYVDLTDGVKSFDWTHPETQAACVARFIQGAAGVSRKREGANWTVSAEVEVFL